MVLEGTNKNVLLFILEFSRVPCVALFDIRVLTWLRMSLLNSSKRRLV